MLDLTPVLQRDSKEPLYQQLTRYIRQEIHSGRIPNNEKLPSIRNLSNSLELSKTTIDYAYQALLLEGYIESRPRSGYFVANSNDSSVANTSEGLQLSKKSFPIIPPIEFDFNPEMVDVDHFPYRTWCQIIKRSWVENKKRLNTHGESQGELVLRIEISNYLRRLRACTCKPEQIIIGSGIEESIGILCSLFCDKTVVAMEDPGPQLVRSSFQKHKFEVQPIPLESDGLNINILRKNHADLVYITPSHQFPLGMVMPIEKRIQLLQWAKEQKRFVIEDDSDGEFRYESTPIPSLQGLDPETVIYIGTFSKLFFPGFRMNYMVLPNSLLNLYKQKFTTHHSAVSKIDQLAMHLFMEEGHLDQHIRRMRKVYQKKHSVLIESIQSQMGQAVKIMGYNSGLHVCIEIQNMKTVEELLEKAALSRVGVYSFSEMWMRRHLEQLTFPMIFLGFGGMSTEKIREGIHRLKNCWFSENKS